MNTTAFFDAWKPIEKFLWGAGAAALATSAGLGYDYIVGRGFDVQWGHVAAVLGAGALLGLKNYVANKHKPSPPDDIQGIDFGSKV